MLPEAFIDIRAQTLRCYSGEYSVKWYFYARLVSDQRLPSRVLQIIERQQIEAEEFRFRASSGEIHLQCTITADPSLARRIGLLLRKLERAISVAWIPEYAGVADLEMEKIAVSIRSDELQAAETNPNSCFWRGASVLSMQANSYGVLEKGHETEVLLRWTGKNLYFLFICAYDELWLRSGDPVLDRPTDRLWEHDVAEVFVSPGDGTVHSYREFELSPRGEWLELDIAHRGDGEVARALLHSGFEVAARIDDSARKWFGFFRIPYNTIIGRDAAVGDCLRINFFRSQGRKPTEIAWQPTYHQTFHVPSRFGALYLAE